MEFIINYNKWKIEEKSKEELKELYEKENDESSYVFGVTIKSKHIIYINNDLCYEQKIRTLKHELTHCYIWEYGLYNANMTADNEELICDIVSASNDFINEIINNFKKEEK